MNLETGEALVSFLDEKGAPGMVQRAKILFPLSQIGAITPEVRATLIKDSLIYGKYDTPVDRESAFEVLMAEREAALQAEAEEKAAQQEIKEKAAKEKASKKSGTSLWGKVSKAVTTAIVGAVATSVGTAVSNKVSGKKSKGSTSVKDSAGQVVKKATTAATRTITREISRSILGNLIK